MRGCNSREEQIRSRTMLIDSITRVRVQLCGRDAMHIVVERVQRGAMCGTREKLKYSLRNSLTEGILTVGVAVARERARADLRELSRAAERTGGEIIPVGQR
jgi:hypothetical protein